MKKYEALVIIAQKLDEEALEENIEKISSQITSLEGSVEHVTRMGRQTFARSLNKREAGFYLLFAFSMPPSKVLPLRERFKSNEGIFRAQITVAPKTLKTEEKPVAAEAR